MQMATWSQENGDMRAEYLQAQESYPLLVFFNGLNAMVEYPVFSLQRDLYHKDKMRMLG
jgi:hypothetical protein